MGSFLTKKQKEELLNKLHSEKNRKCSNRIKVILLLDEGEPVSQIAKYFFTNERTVKNYLNIYKKRGLEGLLVDNHSARSSYLSAEQKKELVLELDFKIYSSIKKIIEYVKKRFGVLYTVSEMSSLLRSLGFSYEKLTVVPEKTGMRGKKWSNYLNFKMFF